MSAPSSAASGAAAAAPVAAHSPPTAAVSSPSPPAVTSSPSQDPIAKCVILPRCATWFALDSISSIEKRMLPEFFEHEALHRTQFPPGAKLPSSKTPQIYMKYRNYMVHAYRQQPHVYLTATACRRNLAGDACAIMRVHEFLTHWGLINYDVPPHAMPPVPHANYSLKSEFSATTNANNSTNPLALLVHEPTNSKNDDELLRQQCERCGAGDVSFELTPEAKKTLLGGGNGLKKDLPLQPFGLRPGSGVCDDCYLARSFPDGVDATDFVRVHQKTAWTKEEDALLMEAVSTSASSGGSGSGSNSAAGNSTNGNGGANDACDWNQIAGKVKTKSAEECVVRFLELPLLPHFTAAQGAGAGAGAGDGLAARTQLPMHGYGYAESGNASILEMAQLIRDVDPFVAKAAARAAIQAIHELHQQPPRELTAVSESVKREELEGRQKEGASGDVEMTNGSADAVTVETAAAAVVSASEAAGVVAIKSETSEPATNGLTKPSSDGDVEMTTVVESGSAAAAPAEKAVEQPVVVTKETLAVVQEASHATAAALLATRADAIANDLAKGATRDLVTELLQNQLHQLELKMQQVALLEKALETEKEMLTRERHALYMDRLAFAQQKLHGNSKTAAL